MKAEKRFFYIIEEEANGKYFSHVEALAQSMNLIKFFERFPRTIAVTTYSSRNEAERVSAAHNETWRSDGRLMTLEEAVNI